MIKLQGTENFFSLDVKRALFEGKGCYQDWLEIEIVVRNSQYNLKKKSDCLTLSELKQFKIWVQQLSSDGQDRNLFFMESEIALAYKAKKNLLIIVLDCSFHPQQGHNYNWLNPPDSYKLPFSLSPSVLKHLTTALDFFIFKYEALLNALFK